MLGTAIHMLRGTPYVYQGEEIAMTNPHFKNINEYKDVETLNNYKLLLEKGKTIDEAIEILGQKSRDNSRTPVQWNNNENAGFTVGTPWIDVAKNYSTINVESNLKDEESVFYHYKKLIELRREYKVISHGDFIPMYEESPQVFGYMRKFEDEKLLVINNFYENEIEIEIPEIFVGKNILIKNYNDILLNGKK